MKDKSYRALPLGLEAAQYLRAKRKQLTKQSYRDYEACLDKLARHFADVEIDALEPPLGTERLEEFLDAQWGERSGCTYNKNLSILRDFFKFEVLRGKLHGDPTLPIERARKRPVYRTTFTADQRAAILASNPTDATESPCASCSTTGCGRAPCSASSSVTSTTSDAA